MDLKVYYQKIRQLEASLKEESVVTVSLETPDGGRAGVLTEVPRRIAAQLVVEGKARLATPEESKEFQEQATAARQAAEQRAEESRLPFALAPQARRGRARGKA
jgi:hypothetical protein